MTQPHDLVILFDVDNTLLDNDRIQADLSEHLAAFHGPAAAARYWAIFEQLRVELGYADYLGAVERYRLENLRDPRVLRLANWLVDYPFADRLYPGALDAVRRAAQWGPIVVLSDGDAVFQPRKIERSGLWSLFGDNVLIFIHKELELDEVERRYPAKRYVMIDDKLRVLGAIKHSWGDRVVSVFARQGHYAADPQILASYPNADITIDQIAELVNYDLSAFQAS
ncbi:HAD family hydrolase [Methylocapsa aurea]|uniref:HAD family hydrolase n=1 Tax=Methylocapsa aurea TaxID=663610 RepID=UPI000566AB66|nr:HAD family hydrolase [Methylocapsa aurea]